MGPIKIAVYCTLLLVIGQRTVSPASIIDSYVRSNNNYLETAMGDQQEKRNFEEFKRERDAFIGKSH